MLVLASLPSLAQVKIGLLLDDLTVERWQNDRDYFVARAMEQGAKVYVKSANGDSNTQIAQIENMIQRRVSVVVIIPSDGTVLGEVLKKARQAGIKILSYDRLITQAPVDLYLSFDNVRVGEMQAEALLKAKPKGKYFLLGGSPSDNNAKMFREGQMKILQPAIDSGAISLVGDGWAVGWSAKAAFDIMQEGLTKTSVDAVVASNDGTAGGVIEALNAKGLAGKVPVSGQDAELAALRRIVDGAQTMTVYKSIKDIANKGADLAILLGSGEAVDSSVSLDNGFASIKSILLEPVSVNKDNMATTVFADGYHSKSEVYQ